MKLADLAKAIDGELIGDGTPDVTGAAPLAEAGPADVTFLANERYEKYVADTQAAAVIVAADYSAEGVTVIRCKDPYFAFRQAMVALYGYRQAPFAGISVKADVAADASLGADVAVGNDVTICAGASIGERTVLYPGVFVGPDAKIGDDCVLHPNVVIYDKCIVGNRVTIHANSVIGQDGFGYATYQGVHQKIPQAGIAVIEDDVELGAGCTVDRATIGRTVIGAGSKFSNLVAIGHGCKIGPANLMVAQAGIAGSTTTGKYCVLGGQAGVVGHLKIGDFVSIGAQAGVTNDIQANSQVWGTPASPLTEAKRQAVVGRQLPKIKTKVMALEKALEDLRRQIADCDDE